MIREAARLLWLTFEDWLFVPLDRRVCRWANVTHDRPAPVDCRQTLPCGCCSGPWTVDHLTECPRRHIHRAA